MARGDAGEADEGQAVRAALRQARGRRNPLDTDQTTVPELWPGPAGLPSPLTPPSSASPTAAKAIFKTQIHHASLQHQRLPGSLRRNTLIPSKAQDALCPEAPQAN